MIVLESLEKNQLVSGETERIALCLQIYSANLVGNLSTNTGLLHGTNPEDARPLSPPSCPGQQVPTTHQQTPSDLSYIADLPDVDTGRTARKWSDVG